MSAAASPHILDALRQRLANIEAERIDRVWLFPPRPVGEAESSLAVIALVDGENADRRVVLTLHCTVRAHRGRITREDRLVDQGSAPADRVESLIRGVLHRLRDPAEVPRSETIAGVGATWAAFLDGDAATDPA